MLFGKKKKPSAPEQKPFKYLELPEEPQPPFISESLDLQSLFQSCNAELGLQQSKRDQLIAFYLTVCGLASGYAFSAGLSPAIRAAIFAVLAVLGAMWCLVILRYRIYKEAYWISCRTINSLYAEPRGRINKAVVQHNFFLCMEKCMGWAKHRDGKSFSLPVMIKKNMKSAELLMFMTLRLLSALCSGMAVLMLSFTLHIPLAGYIAAPLLSGFQIVYGVIRYNLVLRDYYTVICDKTERSFNRAFEKAWHLHIFCK